ncbi:hypothetical protein VTJ83DRAFT_334 [Remersonia thermophila]|uniref:Fungal-type protein kinase domain-containing protein n=1 Tax=Remersonia thermophila TaxID=72144 RepID=A0ABR4DKS8_9PEZI
MSGLTEFYLTTLWLFKAEVVEKVIDELSQTFDGATFIYDDEYEWFLVTCPEELEADIRHHFAEITHEIEADAFELYTDEILDGTKLQPSFNNEFIYRGLEDKPDGPGRPYRVPSNLAYCLCVGTWDGLDRNPTRYKVKNFIAAEQLERLKAELGIDVHINLSERLVYIGADNEEAIYQAKKRLDTLLTIWLVAAEGRRVKHVVYTEHYTDPDRARPEDDHDCEFTADIRYLFNIDMNLPRSTLLDRLRVDNLDELYKKIHQEASSIRICPWDSFRNAHFPLLGPRIDTRPRTKSKLTPRPDHTLLIVRSSDSESKTETAPSTVQGPSQGTMPSGWDLTAQLSNLGLENDEAWVQMKPSVTSPQGKEGTQTTAVKAALVSSKTRKKVGARKTQTAQGETEVEEPYKQVVTPSFTDEIENAMKWLLTYGPLRCGLFSVRAELGRVVLEMVAKTGVAFNNTNTPSNGWKKSELIERLNREYDKGQNIHFTKILSTHGCDIQEMINARVSGTRLWKDFPSRQWTTYSFHCSGTDDGSDRFIIDVVDDPYRKNSVEVTYLIRPDENALDEAAQRLVYVHGIWRNWDLRIVTRHVDVKTMEQKYGALARELTSSVSVYSDKQDAMEIKFAPNVVNITGVRILIKWLYHSLDGKSALEITEVVELDIIGEEEPPYHWNNAPRMVARDRSKSLEDTHAAIGQPTRWYEAAVVSLELDKIFVEQNARLRLGGVAPWRADDLVGQGLVQSLYRPALETLRKMDRVGGAEDNGLRSERYSKAVRHNDGARGPVGIGRR